MANQIFMAMGVMIQAVALASGAAAATLNVDQANGSCNDVTGSPVYCKVSAAADAANLTVGLDLINVAAGTYTDAVNISQPLSIIGAGSGTTFLTGGIRVTGTWGPLTLDRLNLSGWTGVSTNAVINGNGSSVSNYRLADSVLDCGWNGTPGDPSAARLASYRVGHGGGVLVWQRNEIKNCGNWYVADNTSSDCPTGGHSPLTSVNFSDNYVHHVNGTIAWRGRLGSETQLAVVSGNTFDYSMIASATLQAWAALEINSVLDLRATNNVIKNVPEASWGGEGAGFQFWTETAWTADISDNVFTDNYQGVNLLHSDNFGGCSVSTYVPAGSVSCNTYDGNTNAALTMAPNNGTGNTATLDAEDNYWGAADGPSGAGGGTGDAVGTGIDYTPFLSSASVDPCPPPTYSCEGFEPPMNLAFLPPAMGGGPIGRRVKKNRVLPFKATLVDGDGNPATDLVAPPVIQVIYTDLAMTSSDVTDDALTPGKRSEGNQFILAGDKWTFNLWTKLYSAVGTYTATMVSGDTDEYRIDPDCEGIFVIEP